MKILNILTFYQNIVNSKLCFKFVLHTPFLYKIKFKKCYKAYKYLEKRD
jgi:hypothetical protein